MEIKNPLRSHLTSIRMAKIKKQTNKQTKMTADTGKGAGKGAIYSLPAEVQTRTITIEISMEFPQRDGKR